MFSLKVPIMIICSFRFIYFASSALHGSLLTETKSALSSEVNESSLLVSLGPFSLFKKQCEDKGGKHPRAKKIHVSRGMLLLSF